jgi:hypothetical protein
VAQPIERPVLEAGPEPEPEERHPPTLEALAARFSHRRERPKRPDANAPARPDRSRLEREKQAAILARLRAGQV